MVLTLKAQISATTVDRFAISILDFGGTIRLDISCELYIKPYWYLKRMQRSMEMSLLKILGCAARVNNTVIVSSVVYCIAKNLC